MDYQKYYKKTESDILVDEIKAHLFNALGIEKFYKLGEANMISQIKLWLENLKQIERYKDISEELSGALEIYTKSDEELKNMVDKITKDLK